MYSKFPPNYVPHTSIEFYLEQLDLRIEHSKFVYVQFLQLPLFQIPFRLGRKSLVNIKFYLSHSLKGFLEHTDFQGQLVKFSKDTMSRILSIFRSYETECFIVREGAGSGVVFNPFELLLFTNSTNQRNISSGIARFTDKNYFHSFCDCNLLPHPKFCRIFHSSPPNFVDVAYIARL